MNTELQFSVIYLSQENNDINDFDFFIRMIPTKDGNVVSVSVVPRFCLDGKIVKHIKFSVVADKIIDIFMLIYRDFLKKGNNENEAFKNT